MKKLINVYLWDAKVILLAELIGVAIICLIKLNGGDDKSGLLELVKWLSIGSVLCLTAICSIKNTRKQEQILSSAYPNAILKVLRQGGRSLKDLKLALTVSSKEEKEVIENLGFEKSLDSLYYLGFIEKENIIFRKGKEKRVVYFFSITDEGMAFLIKQERICKHLSS